MYLYEIRYKYLDSLDRDWTSTYIVVYDTSTEEGRKLQEATSVAQDENDPKLNKALEPLEVTDSEVLFYYDIDAYGDDISKWANFPLRVQQELDIIIKDIDYITGA